MGGLTPPGIVFALLVGNILSNPKRTAVHQFRPMRYNSPGLACKLIF